MENGIVFKAELTEHGLYDNYTANKISKELGDAFGEAFKDYKDDVLVVCKSSGYSRITGKFNSDTTMMEYLDATSYEYSGTINYQEFDIFLYVNASIDLTEELVISALNNVTDKCNLDLRLNSRLRLYKLPANEMNFTRDYWDINYKEYSHLEDVIKPYYRGYIDVELGKVQEAGYSTSWFADLD